MTFSVSNGTAWVPTKDIHVSNGSGFVQAKSVKVSNGSGWVVAWVPPTTAAVTGPAWVLSNQSGQGGGLTAYIAPATFTFTLSRPLSVQHVSFQMSYAGGAWAEYGAWSLPTAGSWTWDHVFDTNGAWKVRVVVTQLDGVVVTSAEVALTCYLKNLHSHSSSTTPAAGSEINLYPSCSADCAPGQTANHWYYRWVDPAEMIWRHYTDAGSFNWPTSGEMIDWMYVEDYADGSTINAVPVRVDVQAVVAPPTEVVLNGGHCHNIQAAMDSAAAQGLPLRLTGTFYCYTTVYIPDNLYITATGAMFYLNSTSPAEGAGFDSGRWKNNPKGNAAGYGQAGGFTIDGGTFDGNGEGCMTFSHSPGFVVKNATFYRYCSTANTGHAIETNSSGGEDNVSGPYTVQIVGNTFLGTDRGQRSNTNDEPCHYDWNWDGSGSSPPVWKPGDPVSTSTQTMCHNMLIQNNTFHRRSETGGWQFALCAIGGHDSSDSAVRPSYRHNHVYIVGNVMHGATGGTGTSPNKGAIHLFRGRQMVANSNSLHGGVTKRYITAEDSGDVGYCSAAGNTSANPTLSNPNSIVVEG